MMLGFPPPLFFQICWRFVSPAIIFVSSSGALPAPTAPWPSVLLGGQQSKNRKASTQPELKGFGHLRGLDSQMCAHSEALGPGLGLGRGY